MDEETTAKRRETIAVEGLTKRYGHVEALAGIDFRVQSGEIVGFLGPNGAGKTTTMKILTCFMAATEGDAEVAGFDVRTDSEEVRRRVGYLPENVPLYDEMLVYDYLYFVAEVREVARSRRRERIGEVAEMTGIDGVMGRTIRELSKGFRQRVGLAQAIVHEPEVLILDEPTTGLDPNQIVDIRDVITAIGREKTVIFSTHILQEVTAVCDRIIIIDDGKLVADGALEELEQRVAEAAPGLWVEYETDDDAGVRKMLTSVDGVDKVVDERRRRGTTAFRVDGDEGRIRRAIIEAEAQSPQGLVGLRAVEPTLEDIFRTYTAGTAETAVESDVDETPITDDDSDEEEDGEAEKSASEKPEEVAQ